jgi:hypothetical protein
LEGEDQEKLLTLCRPAGTVAEVLIGGDEGQRERE